MGYGDVVGDRNGLLIIELDWKLANSCCVIQFAQPQNYQKLPTL